ncbi:tyrosinase family protein [Acidovorax sp. NCPPB 2350]|nr:tyrosinase family protein [Acidovorax sp. NCPPB 2350]
MINKRNMLRAAVAAGAVTTFSGLVPGLQQVLAAPKLRVRRCVNTMALDDPDLATYRDFVGILQSRPQTQRVSWIGFANQHGDAHSFKYCPHGDWYFLPWHRGFVDMYERAAAALTGNPQFAMPYWDWTLLRQLPAAFTDPTYQGKPNPLYVSTRRALTGRYALTDELVGPEVIKKIYAETSYEAFGTTRNPRQNDLNPQWVPKGGGAQGILESTPHNNVHNNIGGFMPQSNSPRDPIFMMHHGNIDRIWAAWNALGRKNSADPLWLNMPFTNNYIASNGSFYSRKVSDLLSTAALGYTYDNLPASDSRPIDPRRLANLSALFNPKAAQNQLLRLKKTDMAAALAGTSVGVPFQLKAQDLAPLRAPASGLEAAATPREVVALIRDIRIADNVRAIRVFVNRPIVGPDVPVTDPHFVTTLSFLRHDHGHGDGGGPLPSSIVNLTETLQKLSQLPQGLQDNTVTVQLVALPEEGTAPSTVGTVVPASVEIAFI